MSIIQAGCKVKFEDIKWSGVYQLKPTNVYDGATRWTEGMYEAGDGYQVISFQNSKGEVFRARSLPNTIYEAGDKVNIEISEVTTFPSKV